MGVGFVFADDTGKIFNYVPVHGQSLSVGDYGYPLIHSIPHFGGRVKLFNGVGTNGPGYEKKLSLQQLSYLVDFREGPKETHAWAFFKVLDSLGFLDGTWLYSPSGVGGKKISELTHVIDDQGWGWGNVDLQMRSARGLMPSGMKFHIPFALWIHGEADSGSRDFSEYKSDLRNYHDRLLNHAASFGNKHPFPIFFDQPGKAASLDVANALWEYSKEYSGSYLVGPKYWLNRLYFGDEKKLHLNAYGYMLQGDLFGSVVSEYLKHGDKWAPLSPRNIQVLPNKVGVKIDFHVPRNGSLVVDTVTLPEAPGYGMQLKTAGRTINPIETIVDGNSVIWNFSEPVTVKSELRFGESLDDRMLNGGVKLPCTNLRSNVPLKSQFSGIDFYDWAVLFSAKNIAGALNPDVDNLWVYGDWSGEMLPYDKSKISKGTFHAAWLDGVRRVRVSGDVVSKRGAAFIWVGDARVPLPNGEISVDIDVGSKKRMLIQADKDGFDGIINNIRIVKIN